MFWAEKENKAKDTYSITSGPKEQPDAEKQPERTVPVDTKEYGITIDGGNIRTENKNGLTMDRYIYGAYKLKKPGYALLSC